MVVWNSIMNQSQLTDRRSFLKQAVAGGVAAPFFIRNLISAPPSSTLRLASFGAGGMAYWTLQGIATHRNVKLVAMADVDTAQAQQAMQKHPDAHFYQDWRRMLDKERKNLDIACIGTPDHMHAPLAMSAMQLGLHVYVQKPLTHTVYEARRLAAMARKKKLVTQMGIQIHSTAEYRTAVSLIQSGAIGQVKEVHCWVEKTWGDPVPTPDRSDPVPSTLDWNGWLGVAEPRPYLSHYYHPANWRKRIDFGTATMGDMACHILDPVFESLQLTAPVSVRSEGPAPAGRNWAVNASVHYVFPGTRYTADKLVKVAWYDGDQRPPQEVQALLGTHELPSEGSIFVGTKGALLVPHVAKPALFPEQQYRDFTIPVITPVNHYHQFVDAVLGKGTASAPFDYSAALTEVVLLGVLSTRFPRTTLEWNAAKMKFGNSPEASRLLRSKYRSGWRVKGLS
jgi:predicted dehydrogenase